nr:FMN-binding negative transcriptional regulator [uncultured Undibacterium sp.]
MYLPTYHEEKDLDVLHTLIQTHPLGTWVSMTDGGLDANHIPFILDKSRGELGVLRAHVARANPIWKMLSSEVPSIVTFQGPQSYITPNWYPSKQIAGKVVPTWNYTVVHAYGTATAIEDRDWILQMVSDLTDRNEASAALNSVGAAPWKVADAPEAFIQRLLGAIVGIEIPITAIKGRWKLSQDEAMEDRVGTAKGLSEVGTTDSIALSDLVNSRIDHQAFD